MSILKIGNYDPTSYRFDKNWYLEFASNTIYGYGLDYECSEFIYSKISPYMNLNDAYTTFESKNNNLYHQWFDIYNNSIPYDINATKGNIPDWAAIQDFSMVVETEAELVSGTTKTLEDWLDHILNSVFINEDIHYTLDDSTRARLSQYQSPEFTIKDYNLYQAISEVAEFLGGVDWEITENNEIRFIFFNELPIQDLPVDVDTQAIDGVSDLNGYQSSLQINAENISLQSLATEGWYNPRSEE